MNKFFLIIIVPILFIINNYKTEEVNMKKKIGIMGHDNQKRIISGLENAFETLNHSVIKYPIIDIPKTDILTSSDVSQDLDLIIILETEIRQFRNNTNIPIILYFQDPEYYLTVENPNLVALKHPNTEVSMFKTFYLPPAIDPTEYSLNQKKNIFISDISRDKNIVSRNDYLDILERSQHIIIKPGNISVRALEALALKTIPIIIAEKDLRSRYRMLGFNKSNCYFISIEPTINSLLIPNYNEKIANNGFQLVRKNHTWKNRAQKILEKAAENDLL